MRVKYGLSSTDGTDWSMSGNVLMKVRVSSGKVVDDLYAAAEPSPAQQPGLQIKSDVNPHRLFVAVETDRKQVPCVPAEQQQRRKTPVPHLGLGTCSSGTGVHTDSLLRCSLNLPLNAFSMSSM